MDEEKFPAALGLAIAVVALAPLVTLLVPAIMVGSGTMEETFDFETGARETSGFFPAFGQAYAASFTVWPIALVYVAALMGTLLRLRAPLGGGNAAGTVVLLSATTAFTVQAAFTSPGNGVEAFGAALFGFFMALPGAVIVGLVLAMWGRRLIATDVHFEALAAKNTQAENAYMDE